MQKATGLLIILILCFMAIVVSVQNIKIAELQMGVQSLKQDCTEIRAKMEEIEKCQGSLAASMERDKKFYTDWLLYGRSE